jgi:hypothetical protein
MLPTLFIIVFLKYNGWAVPDFTAYLDKDECEAAIQKLVKDSGSDRGYRCIAYRATTPKDLRKDEYEIYCHNPKGGTPDPRCRRAP